jgi:hypothetical protein
MEWDFAFGVIDAITGVSFSHGRVLPDRRTDRATCFLWL